MGQKCRFCEGDKTSLHASDCPVRATIERETPSGTNQDRFRVAYLAALEEQIRRHPDDYAYPIERAPEVVEKMLRAYAKGAASSGPAMKAAARKLGIQPTLSAVRAFLNEGAAS